MRGQKSKNKQINLLAALCFAMALVLLLSSAGVTLARYFRRNGSAGAAIAAPFYLTSDKLEEMDGKGEDPYYQIAEPAAGNQVTIDFSLYNYVDKLRCTKETVMYTCQVVSVDDSAAVIAEKPLEELTGPSENLSSGFKTKPVSFTLSKSDFGTDRMVRVIVKSESPYVKTISARFGFDAQQYHLQWMVEDTGGAVVLELAGGDGGNVTVTWPTTLSPDLSNEVFQGAAPGQVTFAAQSGVRYALTFLKADPGETYLKEDFTVTSLS